MTIDPNLVSYAKNRCAYYSGASLGNLKNGYGELLRFSHVQTVNCLIPINSWFQQRLYYKSQERPSLEYNSFTQLVWAATTKLGCAACEWRSQQEILYLCIFAPAGNIPGQYRNNVLLQ